MRNTGIPMAKPTATDVPSRPKPNVLYRCGGSQYTQAAVERATTTPPRRAHAHGSITTPMQPKAYSIAPNTMREARGIRE
jgi:hypothetical protein